MKDRQERIYKEFHDLHNDVVEEFKTQQTEYWQGKKDGLRIARIYVLEALDMEEANSARSLRESSPSARSTTLEILREMARQARFYIGEALWMERDNEPLHPLSRVNWSQWVSWYDRLVEKGIVPEADGAID
jgi:hypothetical protein